jgi:hypothetical protein
MRARQSGISWAATIREREPCRAVGSGFRGLVSSRRLPLNLYEEEMAAEAAGEPHEGRPRRGPGVRTGLSREKAPALHPRAGRFVLQRVMSEHPSPQRLAPAIIGFGQGAGGLAHSRPDEAGLARQKSSAYGQCPQDEPEPSREHRPGCGRGVHMQSIGKKK